MVIDVVNEGLVQIEDKGPFLVLVALPPLEWPSLGGHHVVARRLQVAEVGENS